MYNEEMRQSMAKVEANRKANAATEPRRMTAEEKEKLLDVITTHTNADDDIQIYIGTENESDVMKNTTLIFKTINVGGKQLSVGVIGPKRMNYSKVIEMLNGLASGIDKVFGEGALPPGRDDHD